MGGVRDTGVACFRIWCAVLGDQGLESIDDGSSHAILGGWSGPRGLDASKRFQGIEGWGGWFNLNMLLRLTVMRVNATKRQKDFMRRRSLVVCQASNLHTGVEV